MSAQPLAGIRVLDLSQRRPGAFCTKLLAGFGAEVIKIEPPGGDPLRKSAPFIRNEEDTEKGIPHLWFNAGKKSVVLDLASGKGAAQFKRLLPGADVVVETFKPGRLESLGLGFSDLRALNPRVILASVTDFGQTGPYAQFEAEEGTTYALSGQAFCTGRPGRAPLVPGPDVNRMTAGLHACAAVLMSFPGRRCHDRGACHLDISVHEAGLENMELRAGAHWRLGHSPSRAEMGRPSTAPWATYACRDGYAAILGGPFRRWRRLARLLPGGEFLEQTYAAGVARAESESDGEELSAVEKARQERGQRVFLEHVHTCVTRWAATRSRKEIMEAAAESGLAFGAIQNLEEAAKSEQLAARGFFQVIDHPATGPQPYASSPFRISGQSEDRPRERAPLLGEHRSELGRLSASPDRTSQGPKPDDSKREALPAPLEGLRVIDLTGVEAGPHATRLLADYGAEVIKVEYPERLDVFRGMSPHPEHYNGLPHWEQLNRNKKSVTLDLKCEAGRNAFMKLVAQSDVLVENFRAGVLDRLGLGYDRLCDVSPGLVLVSMPGYGSTGPLANLPAYGASIEALSGAQCLSAYGADGKPQRIRETDVVCGVVGACAALAGLVETRLGERKSGRHIEVAQIEAICHSLLGEQFLQLAMNDCSPAPTGNRHTHHAPQGCYACRGDDQWIFLAVRSESEWSALCQVVGHSEWTADERFACPVSRQRHHDHLDEEISAWCSNHSHFEAMQILQEAGIPAGAVLSLGEVVEDPHVIARGWFQPDAADPRKLFMGYPFRISNFHPPAHRPGPDLGESNDIVFRELIGLSPGEAASLSPSRIRTAFHLDPPPG